MGPVRDFVRDVWKIGAVCAAGAFLVSLVIGLIAGNPFGAVFLRALLFAVIFAGLGAGLRVVVKRYLPELVASIPNKAGAGEPEHRGAAVDIVLPEDEGLRRQTYGGTDNAARSPEAGPSDGESDGGAEEAMDVESIDEDTTSPAEAQALGELAEELAEELPEATEELSPGGKRGDESLEEVGPAEETQRSPREPSGDIDSLPDIAALEPPSDLRSAQGSTRSARFSTAGERPGDAVRNVLSGQDPATLARALRTVLKKDEKG